MTSDVAGSTASPLEVTLNPTNVKEILSWLKNKYGWKLHKKEVSYKLAQFYYL